MIKKILVPLDGSHLAEGIIPIVSGMASKLGAATVLLSVISEESIAVISKARQRQGQGNVAQEVLGSARGGAMRYLVQLRDANFPGSDVVVGDGSPAETIVSEQMRLGCDMIAISTHGRTGIARSILGSVMDKVLHLTGVPLLVVRPEAPDAPSKTRQPITKIIVPLDGSAQSETVLPHVEGIALGLSASVTLIQAIKFPIDDVFLEGGYYVDRTPIEDDMVESADIYLTRAAEGLKDKGIDVEWKTVLESPALAVVDFARQTTGGLIALSTRGGSGVARWLVGSVTEKVVRDSGTPVLVVPPPKPTGQ